MLTEIDWIEAVIDIYIHSDLRWGVNITGHKEFFDWFFSKDPLQKWIVADNCVTRTICSHAAQINQIERRRDKLSVYIDDRFYYNLWTHRTCYAHAAAKEKAKQRDEINW